MKKKTITGLICVSTVLFLGFVGLYIYLLVFNPNTDNWPSFSIGYNIQPSSGTNSPAKFTYPPYDGGHFHFTIAKDFSSDVRGCRLVFFNQSMPFHGVRAFPFPSDDKITIESRIFGYGILYGSGTHSTRMLDCSDNDRTGEAYFMGYGIFFYDMSHSVDKDKSWWTLMISLWYPIILFAILPAIFAVKKLRGRKPASTKNTPIEK